ENFRGTDECLLPSRERPGVGRCMESLLSLWRMHGDHEPRLKGRCRASVLDCGSPLPLLRPRAGCESARGLAQSKISRCDGRFMQRSGRRRFAELASIALLLLVGVVPLPAADTGASDRKIPPPGIHIPDADRRELEA